MSEISKQALKVENSTQFPNNNAGLITPSNLRAFNEDMIDSLVDEITYNEDSASWNNSIDALNQFTSSQQPSFTALNEFTESQLAINSALIAETSSLSSSIGVVSSEVDELQLWSSSVNEIKDEGVFQGYSTRLHFYGNVSASIVPNVDGPIASINIPFSSVDTGSLLLTASFDNGTRDLTFTKGDSSQFSVNIPDASGSILPSGVVSGSSQIILQDTTGLLSGSRIDGEVTNSTYSQNTIVYGKNVYSTSIAKGTPLYFTGSGTSGNLVGILPADAGNPLLMPAGGIAGETIDVGAEGIVLIDGFINGVDTSLFQPGDEVFVAVGGGYTNTPPTGSTNLVQKLGNVEKSAINGSGVINGPGAVRSVPNIQEGYTWVGDGDGVAQAVATSSFAGDSFPYIGDAQITGSLSVSETIKSQVYINPQTLSGSLTIPTDNNAMLVGPVSIDGTLVVEGNSNLLVLSQVSGSGGTTSAFPYTGDAQITGSLGIRHEDTGSIGFQVIGQTTSQETNKPLVLISGSEDDIPQTGVVINTRVDINAPLYAQRLQINNVFTDNLYSNSGGSTPIRIQTNSIFASQSPSSNRVDVGVSGSVEVSGSLIVNDDSTFIGNQIITGSLIVSSSTSPTTIFYGGNAGANSGMVMNGRLDVNGQFVTQNVYAGSVYVDTTINKNGPGAIQVGSPLTLEDPNNPAGSQVPIDLLVSGSATITGSVSIHQVLNLMAQDPLPSGNIGDIAVSGSSLYFYNGAWTVIV